MFARAFGIFCCFCFSTAAAAAAAAAATALRTAGWSYSFFFFNSNSFAQAIWWWMLLNRTLRKVTCTDMSKNMYVVTPRCAAAAAVVSSVVLGRPTKEYTHPYSMMHRRLCTAGIEVAPHYHQLLVCLIQGA